MKIRKTQIEDLDAVMDVYSHARLFMQQTGNITQWVDGYPSKELLTHDIQKGNSYLCLDIEEQIVGVFSFIVGDDITYASIYKGQWLNDNPYGVVHRLASNGKVKGVAKCCLAWSFSQCPNLRIDTHADNVVMQHLLKSDGYEYCGIICCQNGTERVAFQKTK